MLVESHHAIKTDSWAIFKLPLKLKANSHGHDYMAVLCFSGSVKQCNLKNLKENLKSSLISLLLTKLSKTVYLG